MNKKLLTLSLLCVLPLTVACKKTNSPSSEKTNIDNDTRENVTILGNQSLVKGAYSITWLNNQGSSYQLVDGGVLPTKGDIGNVINFKLALDFNAKKIPEVKVNDVVLAPINEVYTFTVVGDTTISVESNSMTGITAYSSCYLVHENKTLDNTRRLVIDEFPAGDAQYTLKGVYLNKDEKVAVFDKDKDTTYNSYLMDDNIVDGYFVAPKSDSYNVYVMIENGVTNVHIGIASEVIAVGEEVQEDYTYYLYCWEKNGGYYPISYSDGKLIFKVPAGNSTYLIAKFEKGTEIPATQGSTWFTNGFISQTNDLAADNVFFVLEWK